MNGNKLMAVPALLLVMSIAISPMAAAGKLKPTMKEMRLHYKAALETDDPALFNREIALFMQQLQIARQFDFSPERKALSLEGLKRVETQVSAMPSATRDNLNQLQAELQQVDQLRKEYHKKVKPGALDLLLQAFKDAVGW